MRKSEKRYNLGDRIVFTPKKGGKREGSVRADRGSALLVHLDGDPFAVDIAKDQCVPCKVVRNMVSSTTSQPTRRSITDMPTASEARVTAKQLRLDAQGLGIEGYESMTRAELEEAIAAKSNGGDEKPKRGRSRKVEPVETTEETKPRRGRPRKAAAEASDEPRKSRKASKATKTRPAPTQASDEGDSNVNPFRKGSNLHVIVPLLVKGGKRSTLAAALQKKVQLHHYSGDNDAPSGPSDYDKRITLCATTLRDKHGWAVVQEGRGMSGWLQAVPPGGEMPDRPNARVSTKA